MDWRAQRRMSHCGVVSALKHSATNVNLSEEFVWILVFIINQGSRTPVSKEKVCFLSIRLLQCISSFFSLSKHWSKRKQRKWEESWSIQRTSFGVWSVEQGEILYRLSLCCIHRQAPVVTSIKFLLTASGYNQGKKSWDLRRWSSKIYYVDLLASSPNQCHVKKCKEISWKNFLG